MFSGLAEVSERNYILPEDEYLKAATFSKVQLAQQYIISIKIISII
jgi:hypothetical protein